LGPVAFLKDDNIEKVLAVVLARLWIRKFLPAYCAEGAVTDKEIVTPSFTRSMRQEHDPTHSVVCALSGDGGFLCISLELQDYLS
jgi:hypothetical protein